MLSTPQHVAIPTQAILSEKACRNWPRSGLILLDFLQKFTLIVIQIQVQEPTWCPLPRRDEERMPVDGRIGQDAQQTAASVFCFGELHADFREAFPDFLSEDIGFDIPGEEIR